MSDSARVSRIEWLLLLVLLLLGFSFRIWQISSVGLDHFDEGVYVFSALGLSDSSQPNQLYPEQVKFSPPVYFGLVALAYHIFGAPSDTVAILVNVFLGTLTLAGVWWVSRSWFGAPAGIAATALLAFSEFDIALSRAALTDVAFAFFFVLALGVIARALERQSIRTAVLAGVLVGIAWNTKYHGWFALVIAGIALLPYIWIRRVRDRALLRLLFVYGVVAVVAGICYLPWALFVHSQPGGYSGLLQYQRTLIDGNWWTNLWWQSQMQLFLEGPLTRTSIPVAFLCASLVSSKGIQSTPKLLLILLFLSVAALTIGGAGTAVLLTLLAVPMLLRRSMSLAAWLTISWLAVWFFSAPLYHPYARLVLPFTIASYFIAGLWMAAIVNGPQREVGRVSWQPILTAVGVSIAAAIAFIRPNASDPWRPSRSLPEAVAAMSAFIEPGSRVIVIGEPELAFYLHLADRPAFERSDYPEIWENLRTPVYLVGGVYAARAPVLREGLERLGDRLVPLGKYPVNPNDIRLLDDFPPYEARLYRAHPDDTFELTLYRLSPKLPEPLTDGR